ncbi:MAG: hypothetical protein ACYDAQ_18750 [Mycobacteriales bacterium]
MATLPGLSDLRKLVVAQTEYLLALPETLSALNRSVRSLAETIASTKDAVLALQRIAVRLDGLLDDLEPALRSLAPGISRVAALLDDPALGELLRGVRDTQARVAGIAASTERLTSLVDDAGGRLAALPGAALLARSLRGGKDGPLGG